MENKQKDLNILTHLERVHHLNCGFVIFKGYVFLRGIYDTISPCKYCNSWEILGVPSFSKIAWNIQLILI